MTVITFINNTFKLFMQNKFLIFLCHFIDYNAFKDILKKYLYEK